MALEAGGGELGHHKDGRFNERKSDVSKPRPLGMTAQLDMPRCHLPMWWQMYPAALSFCDRNVKLRWTPWPKLQFCRLICAAPCLRD